MNGTVELRVINWWIAYLAILGGAVVLAGIIYLTNRLTIWHRNKRIDLLGAEELRGRVVDLTNQIAEKDRRIKVLERDLGDYRAYRHAHLVAEVHLGNTDVELEEPIRGVL